jgi:hypothetical protein
MDGSLNIFPPAAFCDQKFTVKNALSCSRGGFPSIRHNEIRDITAKFWMQVCYGVGVEPGLQHVTDEAFSHTDQQMEKMVLDWTL